MSITDVVKPSHTAVLISEMQRGVVGDLATNATRELAMLVQQHALPQKINGLLTEARECNVPVIHETVQFRKDSVGARINTPIFAATLGNDPGFLLEGSPAAEIIPELIPDTKDLLHRRHHGLSAFTGTDLDSILRSLGIETLVIGGVSLNIALIGTAVEAANLGYSVAVLKDGAVGVPYSFGEEMLSHVFPLLGYTPTIDEVRTIWTANPGGYTI